MRQKLLKKVVILAMALIVLTPVFAFSLPTMVAAGTTGGATLDPWGTNTGGPAQDTVGTKLGLGNKDPRAIAAQIINVILGFLGIIAVVIILLGGFKWMTAGGNEDKTGEAKKLIVAGVIGLLIIIASFAIASFVLKQLINATNG